MGRLYGPSPNNYAGILLVHKRLFQAAVSAAALMCITCTGCVSTSARDEIALISCSEIPRELDKVTLPEYRVEPPDILVLEAVTNIRPAESPLKAGDELLVQVANGLPLDRGDLDPETFPIEYELKMQFEQDFKVINRIYRVGTNGVVDLGPEYGRVKVVGLTVDQAKAAIENHMKKEVGLKQPKVAVSMPDVAGIQQIVGEHLVHGLGE